ncbi:MAG: hypothetical protein ACRES7_10485, partial [Gammaproteobacteria bacterium]
MTQRRVHSTRMPSGRGHFCFAKSNQKHCADGLGLRASVHYGYPALLARRGPGGNSACAIYRSGLKH